MLNFAIRSFFEFFKPPTIVVKWRYDYKIDKEKGVTTPIIEQWQKSYNSQFNENVPIDLSYNVKFNGKSLKEHLATDSQKNPDEISKAAKMEDFDKYEIGAFVTGFVGSSKTDSCKAEANFILNSKKMLYFLQLELKEKLKHKTIFGSVLLPQDVELNKYDYKIDWHKNEIEGIFCDIQFNVKTIKTHGEFLILDVTDPKNFSQQKLISYAQDDVEKSGKYEFQGISKERKLHYIIRCHARITLEKHEGKFLPKVSKFNVTSYTEDLVFTAPKTSGTKLINGSGFPNLKF